MLSKDVLRHTLGAADRITKKYVEDLTQEELGSVPIEGMNPIAWQLGHLIGTEYNFANAIKPNSAPPLPEGFLDAHRRQPPGDPNGYLSAAEYIKLMDEQRANTLKVLDELSEEQLTGATPIEQLRQMCPTIASTINLIGSHYLMHAGQWVAVRRKAGKPIAI